MGRYAIDCECHAARGADIADRGDAALVRYIVNELTNHESEGTLPRVYKHDTRLYAPARRHREGKLAGD